MEILNRDAEKQGFKVRTTNAGIYFLPVIEGKTITEEEYGQLDEKIKQEITERSNIVQLETLEIIRKIKILKGKRKKGLLNGRIKLPCLP